MPKRERPGYVTLTLELPIEVADWLTATGEQLAHAAKIAAHQARYTSDASAEARKAAYDDRQAELWNLGRKGFRLFRRYGGSTHISNPFTFDDANVYPKRADKSYAIQRLTLSSTELQHLHPVAMLTVVILCSF